MKHFREKIMGWMDKELESLVGKNVTEVWVSDSHLTFVTDEGLVSYRVEGDCCSYSYFHDIVGVDKLINNGPVLEFSEIELEPGDPGYHDSDCYGGWDREASCGESHDVLAVYGHRIVTEHPVWGEQTTVVAFRNDSNGYYGGWMKRTVGSTDGLKRITDDWVLDS